MANSVTNLDLIAASQSQKEVTANALLDAASPATLFGRRASACAGVVWGFYGGALLVAGEAAAIANGTVTLTASETNYIEATTAGVVSANTSAFTAGRIPLYTAVVGTGTVTSYADLRAWSLIRSVNDQYGPAITLDAADVGADATGTAADLMADHEAAANPHPVYLTQAEADALYASVSSGSGTVTHAGGALTSNALVLGAGAADTKVAPGIVSDGTSKLTLGEAGTSVGAIIFKNATSGTITVQPATGALGTVTLTLPATTGTLALAAQITGTNSGTNTGDETTTTTGALINGATAKTTPVDADFVGLMDSAASNVLKKLSWANIKATAKTYFDTLYAPLSQPFDVHAFYPGIPTASAKVIRVPIARAVTFAANFSGAYFSASANATATTVFDVQKNGSSIGSVSIAASGTTATFTTTSGTSKSFAAGDVLMIVAPASPDATLADPGFVIPGTR